MGEQIAYRTATDTAYSIFVGVFRGIAQKNIRLSKFAVRGVGVVICHIVLLCMLQTVLLGDGGVKIFFSSRR